ncbi:class I SAM-dependent methyltransferase [Fodinibius sediminis]|uniref:Methyltransferase domain-containing protein n=1 Tax=Fodinibius sediminis TaxID=1214077 RepID=A0A521E985_9BACT|nr:class I SAM-dependent methyltransferase [Fodinibius sediminis]SMO80496.1 Methyltransferase domain-containing protein [Fodinibius sediminis]
MSRIAYDPVKDRFASIIRKSRGLRTLFYKLLDLFFLRSWYVRRLLKQYAAPLDRQGHWRMLDAGAGFGQYDRFILHQFSRVTVHAVDVKEDYLRDCRHYFEQEIARDRISFEQQNLLALDAVSDFDFVICIDVLEHIEEDEQVMRNINRALKSDGYFLMHSPSIYSKEDAGEDESFVDEHARTGYSREDIRQKLEASGFTPVDIAYTYGSKGHRAWEWLIKYPMLWLTKIGLWALPVMTLYYIVMLPVGLLLMGLDLYDHNEKGAGIYALAQKEDN